MRAPDDDCLYPIDLYGVDYVDCDNNCLNDADNDGVCDEAEVPGCTDEAALNYNSAATDDDGMCEYPASSVFEIIANSEFHTTLEDLIVLADLDSALTHDGAWTVFAPTNDAITALGSFAVDALLADIGLLTEVLTYHVASDSLPKVMLTDGLSVPMLNMQSATISVDAGGTVFIDGVEIIIADLIADNGVVHVIDAVITPSIEGCMNQNACNWNPIADSDPNDECEYETCSGCLDATACNYDSTATINDLLSCIYPEFDYLDCDGNCLNDVNGDGICDENDIPGCTVENACNYNPAATISDDSCEFESCSGAPMDLRGTRS